MPDLIYEKLNEAPTIRSFITASVSIFNESIDQLINSVFRKNDFAVKSVVDSLFETSGPLSELSIRLKVLLGLGVINHHIFEDIMQFIQFKEFLNNESQEFAFTEQVVFKFANQLHSLQDKSLLQISNESEDKNSLLFQMKQLRQEKVLRSCLILTVVNILERLEVEG